MAILFRCCLRRICRCSDTTSEKRPSDSSNLTNHTTLSSKSCSRFTTRDRLADLHPTRAQKSAASALTRIHPSQVKSGAHIGHLKRHPLPIPTPLIPERDVYARQPQTPLRYVRSKSPKRAMPHCGEGRIQGDKARCRIVIYGLGCRSAILASICAVSTMRMITQRSKRSGNRARPGMRLVHKRLLRACLLLPMYSVSVG
ncbi:hypothetical protein LZ31DRAFT_29360 [Colletotrichum somersetense]|nr:hypothetical protein LZ31DRAFT_29360 [Colletotrichum somersetense]